MNPLNEVLELLKIYKGVPITFCVRLLAKAAGVTDRTIYNWRAGKGNPSDYEAAALRMRLQVIHENAHLFNTMKHEH